VIVGCPENRRIALFQAALSRAGLRPARVVPWLDFLEGRESLTTIGRETMVRIESPGENFEVERELIAEGSVARQIGGPPRRENRIEAEAARRLAFDRGRILYPRQWFMGFRRALDDIARQVIASRGASLPWPIMNVPGDIISMFDKSRCHQM